MSPSASQSVLPGSSFVRIPHPEDVAPRRPDRLPRWMPPVADGSRTSPALLRFSSPSIATARDGGAMRKTFNYRNARTTTAAALSDKAGRVQYVEGPHERRFRKHLEARGDVVELQMQFAKVSWTTREGLRRGRVLDGAYRLDSGRIVGFEAKAHWSFFQVPDLFDDLLIVEEILAAHDVGLERVVGADHADPWAERRVIRILSHRKEPFDASHVGRALQRIARHGGDAPLGAVRDAVHADPATAARIVDAMQVANVVCFPIDRPIDLETAVRATLPQAPDARRLRDVGTEPRA